jgi:iron-sulfur cluster repair protein YtfE (RIC family)
MIQTLPRVAHEHHEVLIRHVDQMPGVGDALLEADGAEVKRRAIETSTFLTTTLIPHVDAAERALYPELERMLQNRHSMAPMRREHEEVRRLAAAFARLAGQIEGPSVAIGTRLAIRRILFQLYALLKIHLAEEEAYLHIVEHGVSEDVADVLAAGLDHPGFEKG